MGNKINLFEFACIWTSIPTIAGQLLSYANLLYNQPSETGPKSGTILKQALYEYSLISFLSSTAVE